MDLSNLPDVLIGDSGEYTLKESGRFHILKNNTRGVVLTAQNKKKQDIVVVKIIPKQNSKSPLQTDHPNIGNTYDSVHKDGFTYLVKEYINGLPINQYFQKQRRKERLTLLKQIVLQILDGLDYIHSNGFIHADIRPSNILITEEGGKLQTKIIDLENAFETGNKESGRRPFGLIYAAPEQILNQQSLFNPSVDLYGLALTILEALSGVPPFAHPNPEILIHLMLSQPLKTDENIPDNLMKLLERSTTKHKFSLPPNKYSNKELGEFLSQAQEPRPKNVEEFKEAFLKCF